MSDHPPSTWVLLHGTPLSPDAWDGVRAHLSVPTVAPDLNARLAAAPADGLLQEDLAAAVLVHDVSDGDLVVVGHSMGGQVGIEMALLAPQRVRRLILVCSRNTPVLRFHAAALALREGVPVDVDAGVRRWFTPDEVAEDGPVVRYARRQLTTAAPLVYARTLEALACYERRGELAAIAAPSVLICGRLDPGCTPAVTATLAADLPRAGLRVIDGWAHMSPFVEPAEFASRLQSAATADVR